MPSITTDTEYSRQLLQGKNADIRDFVSRMSRAVASDCSIVCTFIPVVYSKLGLFGVTNSSHFSVKRHEMSSDDILKCFAYIALQPFSVSPEENQYIHTRELRICWALL